MWPIEFIKEKTESGVRYGLLINYPVIGFGLWDEEGNFNPWFYFGCRSFEFGIEKVI